jgi:alpha-amylase
MNTTVQRLHLICIAIVMLISLSISCTAPSLPFEEPVDPSKPEETVQTDYFGTIRAIEPGDHSLEAPGDWYIDARFYHVWVNAFSDSDGDGIGDIAGLIQKLDYLKELGINAIWLSPIFETRGQDDPQGNMHGYDTTDHYAINPYFGDTQAIGDLLDEAHARDIRVIFDFVPNHVSNAHPWFKAAAAGDPAFEDWFIWSDEDLDAYFGGVIDSTPWNGPELNGKYYYAVFWDGMPDLNYRNPEVRQAMANVLTYWLNFGFDGIRIDAVKYLFETDTDGDPHTAPIRSDAPETMEFFLELREEILEKYDSQGYGKFMVLENWTATSSLSSYARVNGRPAAEMSFDFEIGNIIGSAIAGNPQDLRNYLNFRSAISMPDDFAFGNFLSNHDNVRNRPVSQFGGNEHMAALAASYNILLPGIPFVYYGNEIGMPGLAGSDINLRQDFPWNRESEQLDDDASLLEWYRAMLDIRSYPAVGRGTFTPVLESSGSDDAFIGLWTGSLDESPIVFVGNHAAVANSFSADFNGLIPAGIDDALSTLVGASAAASFSAGKLSTGEIPAHGFRVYALGTTGMPLLIGDRPEAPVQKVFLPGTWNGWDPGADEMTLSDPDNLHYLKTMVLDSSMSYLFKFYDLGWKGYGDVAHRSISTSTGIIVSDEGAPHYNIQLEVPSLGSYQINYDMDDGEFWITGP